MRLVKNGSVIWSLKQTCIFTHDHVLNVSTLSEVKLPDIAQILAYITRKNRNTGLLLLLLLWWHRRLLKTLIDKICLLHHHLRLLKSKILAWGSLSVYGKMAVWRMLLNQSKVLLHGASIEGESGGAALQGVGWAGWRGSIMDWGGKWVSWETTSIVLL